MKGFSSVVRSKRIEDSPGDEVKNIIKFDETIKIQCSGLVTTTRGARERERELQ